MKAREFIPRHLSEMAGVKHVFTYAGGTSAMFLDAIRLAPEGRSTVLPLTYRGGYSVPDMVRVANAFGLPARCLAHDHEVAEALDWLMAQPGPAVLEVKTPVEWASYPKVVVGGDLTQQRPELPPELASRLVEIVP